MHVPSVLLKPAAMLFSHKYLLSAVPECYLCDGDETPNTRICLERLIEIHAHFLPHGSLWSRLLLLSLLASLCTTALLRLS